MPLKEELYCLHFPRDEGMPCHEGPQGKHQTLVRIRGTEASVFIVFSMEKT